MRLLRYTEMKIKGEGNWSVTPMRYQFDPRCDGSSLTWPRGLSRFSTLCCLLTYFGFRFSLRF